mgnify:CR=1 FL=1
MREGGLCDNPRFASGMQIHNRMRLGIFAFTGIVTADELAVAADHCVFNRNQSGAVCQRAILQTEGLSGTREFGDWYFKESFPSSISLHIKKVIFWFRLTLLNFIFCVLLICSNDCFDFIYIERYGIGDVFVSRDLNGVVPFIGL